MRDKHAREFANDMARRDRTRATNAARSSDMSHEHELRARAESNPAWLELVNRASVHGDGLKVASFSGDYHDPKTGENRTARAELSLGQREEFERWPRHLRHSVPATCRTAWTIHNAADSLGMDAYELYNLVISLFYDETPILDDESAYADYLESQLPGELVSPNEARAYESDLFESDPCDLVPDAPIGLTAQPVITIHVRAARVNYPTMKPRALWQPTTRATIATKCTETAKPTNAPKPRARVLKPQTMPTYRAPKLESVNAIKSRYNREINRLMREYRNV